MDTIQNSIVKKFRKNIWRPFTEAIKEFKLIEDGDKIAVCISGGKDSFLLAKCLEELKLHGKIKFELVFILMDPGYKKPHLDKIYKNIEKFKLEVIIFKTKIFELSQGNKNACYLCARKRRGALYEKAMNFGCNKIALGHHFNDVVETVLMSVLYNGEFKTMLPILNSTNYKDMKLIRPLYFVKEDDILSWVCYNNLEFIDCACSVTEKNSNVRHEMKGLINHLKTYNKGADINIMNSTKNVNLKTLISYRGEKNENRNRK